MNRPLMKKVLYYIYSFILVFSAVAFIVTCSFLLAFHSVEWQEEQIRAIAPIVFANVLILTAVLLVLDAIRRRLTIDRAVKEIREVLQRLSGGDFSARVSPRRVAANYTGLSEIGESINRLAEELSGVETLRTDFIANVSHELKTPLAVMQNYGTLLRQPELPEEKRLEYAGAVTDASRRLASLVTNILRLNKLESQQIFPSAEEYDLGEQLCQCLLQYENEWEQKEIEIETDLAEDVRIRADEELLSLVWNNLLSNAFKFTPTGGSVAVRLTADDRYAVVSIRDTGCGMSPEVGAHIFEKFYQGDPSHSARGNGLGLALVKRVMDILQGEIGVESTVGKGSTFTVRIRRN